MAPSKFFKVAVAGVAVAAIAIGIGVGAGIHSNNKKKAAAAANRAECRRLLVVPGIEDNAVDAPLIRRKLLDRQLNETPELVVEYKNMEGWYGDSYPAYHPSPAVYAPAASITKSSSKGLKGTQSPYLVGYTSTKGPKGPKGGKSTAGITSSSKGPKGSKSSSGLTDSKGPKGPKGSKSKSSPVRVIGYLFFVNSLRRLALLTHLFEYIHIIFHFAHIGILLLTQSRQM